jgi:Protein of unknown function (DUF2971)
MKESEIKKEIAEIFKDLEDLPELAERKPLLAHYTSLQVLEKILRSDEIWFSNPLFMNDLEEVRFGVMEGVRLFQESQLIADATGTPGRENLLRHAFNHYFSEFDDQHAFDTYVFCLSEHSSDDTDGVLSMWRGYGGQGNGAALVFRTDSLRQPLEGSPLAIMKVVYESREQRLERIKNAIKKFCAWLKSASLPDEQLWLGAYWLFSVIKFYALKSKHQGFWEEKEWRIIYFPDRNPQGRWKENFKFDYFLGDGGAQPKLKFKLEPLTDEKDWSFASIVDRIILGPSLSSALARKGIDRMLETLGKAEFKSKVCASGIPLRPMSS